MKPAKTDSCSTCSRSIPLTFHHLVPKRMHRQRKVQALYTEIDLVHYGIWMCKDCHKKIHQLFTHEELAYKLFTLEQLLADEAFKQFIRWVKKQTKKVK